MKKMTSLAPLVVLSLSGCALAGQFGLTTATAPVVVAVAVETRAGANCIRETERGATPSALHRFRVGQGRLAFDGTVGMGLSENARSILNQSRELTDSVCPPLPSSAPQ